MRPSLRVTKEPSELRGCSLVGSMLKTVSAAGTKADVTSDNESESRMPYFMEQSYGGDDERLLGMRGRPEAEFGGALLVGCGEGGGVLRGRSLAYFQAMSS